MAASRPQTVLALFVALGIVCAGIADLTIGRSWAQEPDQPHPQGNDGKRLVDHYGDPLPRGAIQRLGTVRLRQPDSSFLSAVAFSHDGKILASAGQEREWQGQVRKLPYRIRLWDVATGKELCRMGGHQTQARQLCFSPDDKHLYSTNHDTINIYDVATGAQSYRRKRRESLAFSGNGSIAAHVVEEGSTVYLKGPISGKTLRKFDLPSGPVRTMAISKDASTFAACSGLSLYVWDIRTGRESRALRPLDQDLYPAIALSDDGSVLAMLGNDGVIQSWRVSDGQKRKDIQAGEHSLAFIAFSPNGLLLASASYHKGVVLWDVVKGKELRTFPTSNPEGLAFSPDGQVLAVAGRTLRLWDVATGAERLPFPAHRDVVESIGYSADGSLLASGSRDGAIRLWDAKSGSHLRLFQQMPCGICSIAFHPNGRTLGATCDDNSIRLWDVATAREFPRFEIPDDKEHDSWMTPDGSVRSEPAPGLATTKWRGFKDRLSAITFSPDGLTLLSGGQNGTIRLWESATARQRLLLRSAEYPNAESCGAFAPDGATFAMIDKRGEVVLRKTADGRPLRRFKAAENKPIELVAFSPDGQTIAATGRHGAVYVWDVESGSELSRFYVDRPPSDFFFSGSRVAFSPDGRILATGTLSLPVMLWEVLTGEFIGSFEYGRDERNHETRALAFSPDGRQLASAGKGDFSIMIWDVTGLRTKGTAPAGDLSTSWERLADSAEESHPAIWQMVAAGDTAVRFLSARLRPVTEMDAKLVTKSVSELDSDRFSIREEAMRAIAGYQDQAVVALRQALAGRPSLEARRRLERLLERTEPTYRDRRRELRALAVLEYVGSPLAREVLRTLATGAPDARLTKEVQRAAERLKRTSSGIQTSESRRE
jgi:WD40 repeat protein